MLPITWGAISESPQNSTRDRTVSRKCKVIRQGLSPMSSAMEVELLVALLHHPLGANTPAPALVWRGEGGSAGLGEDEGGGP